jgi:hypothetical protein
VTGAAIQAGIAVARPDLNPKLVALEAYAVRSDRLAGEPAGGDRVGRVVGRLPDDRGRRGGRNGERDERCGERGA